MIVRGQMSRTSKISLQLKRFLKIYPFMIENNDKDEQIITSGCGSFFTGMNKSFSSKSIQLSIRRNELAPLYWMVLIHQFRCLRLLPWYSAL